MAPFNLVKGTRFGYVQMSFPQPRFLRNSLAQQREKKVSVQNTATPQQCEIFALSVAWEVKGSTNQTHCVTPTARSRAGTHPAADYRSSQTYPDDC